MKLWHWLLVGGGAWWLLRKKPAAAATVPAPVGPTPAITTDPASPPTELIDILRTKLTSDGTVRTFGSGPKRGNVEISCGSGMQVLASMELAVAWAKAQPFSKVSANVGWDYVP